MAYKNNVLVIGYGNPARGDDGIGPAAAELVERLSIDGVTVDSDYQLSVEDAAAVAQHDVVVFIDATVDGNEPFNFYELLPKRQESFSSHSVEPEAVLGLAEELFTSGAKAYMLGIRGYSFQMFHESLTKKASENLMKAIDFLIPVLSERSFQEVA